MEGREREITGRKERKVARILVGLVGKAIIEMLENYLKYQRGMMQQQKGRCCPFETNKGVSLWLWRRLSCGRFAFIFFKLLQKPFHILLTDNQTRKHYFSNRPYIKLRINKYFLLKFIKALLSFTKAICLSLRYLVLLK